MKNWHHQLLSLVLAAGLLVTATPELASAAQSLTVKVNDKKVEYSIGAAPTVQQQTTLVPLRSTLKAMGITLSSVTGNQITAIVNGKSVTVKSKLTKIGGVVYVPIRTFGDLSGYAVSWNAKTRTVQLTAPVSVPVTEVPVSTPPVDNTVVAPADSTATPTAPVATVPPATTGAETPATPTEATNTGGRGFMWEVQANGNTVYLVGSMHIANDSFYPLRKEYDEAFSQADYLGVEVDITKGTDQQFFQQIRQMGTYQDGSILPNHLASDTYAKLGKFLKDNGMESNELDNYKPWVVEMIVDSIADSTSKYKPESGIDLYFLKQAAKRKLPVVELESDQSQLSMLNSFSPQLQDALLYYSLQDFEDYADGKQDDSIEKMAEMWRTGNEVELYNLTTSSSGNPEYHKAMLVDRNIGMVDKIDGYLRNGGGKTYFIVVGAAHYLSDDGIVKLLQKKGYTVVRK